MNLKKAGEWLLDSGTWLATDIASGLRLVSTKLGYPISAQLKTADIADFMQTRSSGTNVEEQFPPEFKYSPLDGQLLSALSRTLPGMIWIAPFGSRAFNSPANPDASGLRQSGAAFALNGLRRHHAESDPDVCIPVPPPGSYHFFTGQFGTLLNALIAVDPGKGALFSWLPASEQWSLMSGVDGLLLSESSLSRGSWRAEMVTEFNSRLYLPTERGLACLTPDLPSQHYRVSYIGQASVIGSPIAFNRKMWAPMQLADGSIQFVNVGLDGKEGQTLTLADGPIELHGGSAPVAYGRMAVWPFTNGQLVLRQLSDGGVATQYVPWSAGIEPKFAFGSPYLSRAGDLWQLCFDSKRDTYVYVQLGVPRPEMEDALTPRLCSGVINYRFSQKQKTHPWQEPEQGDDGGANEIVIPILEVAERTVIGLKLHTSAGLETCLQSSERVHVRLILDDDSSETVFHTAVFSEPWQLRLFCYAGKLWAYHPELGRIDGWELSA